MHHHLTLMTGLLVIGAVLLASPAVFDGGWSVLPGWSDEDTSRVGLPAEAPDLGLVYQGLAPAAKGAPCAGAFEVLARDTCSHGPDQSPPGLVVSRDVKPVAPPAPAPARLQREPNSVPADVDVVGDEGAVARAGNTPALIPEAAPGDEPFAVGDAGVACAGDGRSGKRVQVLYLYEFGKPSRYPQYLSSIRTWAAGVDAIFEASAAETGGIRRVRYVTTPRCQVDVAEVQVPGGSMGSLESTIKALRRLGYNRADRKYLMFADANVYCGISTFVGDRRPGPGNRNNGGPSYGRTDAGCWSAAVAAHQLTHTLGAVLDNAPHSSRSGHCTDGYDLMCYKDAPTTQLRVQCADKRHERRLDCNHDDYFHTNPRPGSFLATHWNVADSDFLLRERNDRRRAAAPPVGEGSAQPAPSDDPGADALVEPGTPQGSAPPSAPASTTPSTGPDGSSESTDAVEPSATIPEPAPSDSSSPSGSASAPPAEPAAPDAPPGPPPLEPVLQVSETTSTASRLVWTTAKPDARYEVSVDGQVVAVTRATRARLIGLRPDTRYQLQVRLADGGGEPYTAAVELRTAPAAQPTPRLWFVLANALTSTAADLYAARTAAGTPLVLNRTEGGAQQLWQLLPAGDGSFQMVSRASGKCVIPLRNNPVVGTPLVQGTCAEGDTTQYWWIGRSAHGFTLRTALGNLVVGLGNQRVGGSRVLVLQEPNEARHQSWTALPG